MVRPIEMSLQVSTKFRLKVRQQRYQLHLGRVESRRVASNRVNSRKVSILIVQNVVFLQRMLYHCTTCNILAQNEIFSLKSNTLPNIEPI